MPVQGIIAKKVGMTQVYGKDGRAIPATVLTAQTHLVIVSGLGGDKKYTDSFTHIASALADGQRVNVRFTRTNRLFPGGTLIFVSTLLRLAGQYPGRITVTYPKDEIVEELLQHIGFLAAFGLPAS